MPHLSVYLYYTKFHRVRFFFAALQALHVGEFLLALHTRFLKCKSFKNNKATDVNHESMDK